MPQRVIASQRRDSTSVIVDAIRKYGARNLSVISRITKIPVETVRYKVKKQLPEMGLSVSLGLDASRFGATGYLIDVNPNEAKVSGKELFKILRQSSYLTYYGKKLDQVGFITKFWIPNNFRTKFEEFLVQILRMNFVRSHVSESITWQRYTSFRPEFYDFRTEKWDIDWQQISRMSERPVDRLPPYHGDRKPDLDKLDLLITKELQSNALASLNSIARKLRVHPKTLRYHFKNHVSGLLLGYYVRWADKHRDQFVELLYTFRGLDSEQYRRVRWVFSSHPFLWMEGGRDGGFYTAWVLAPISQLSDSMLHIRELAGEFLDKSRVTFIDARTDRGYVIPYEMYDSVRGWLFDPDAVIRALVRESNKTMSPRFSIKKRRV